MHVYLHVHKWIYIQVKCKNISPLLPILFLFYFLFMPIRTNERGKKFSTEILKCLIDVPSHTQFCTHMNYIYLILFRYTYIFIVLTWNIILFLLYFIFFETEKYNLINFFKSACSLIEEEKIIFVCWWFSFFIVFVFEQSAK